jgi:ATP-binding cassette subfamily B (MDR/TAP) protein 1
MSKKYGLSVEEAKMHAQRTSPLLSLQFGLIVSNTYPFLPCPK